MAADDDGTFTINIQGPDESTTVFQNQQENALQANPQRADGSNANAERRNVSTRPRSRQTASSYRVPRPASEVLNTAKPVGAAQNTSSSTAMQGSYTVGSSDTMWSIATRYLPPDRSVNEFQIVASIYRHNPNAFIGGNVNRLRAGRISIPSLSEIARESSATGSELLERGTMQLPALATTQPAKSSDHAAATSNARQILDRASQLPSFQATENLVKNARAERQAELEQQTALSVSSPSSQTEDASQNRDPLTKVANEAVADAQGDKETSKPSSAQQEPQKTTAVSASPAANSYSSDNQVAKNFDPDALRIMLEGSQKQIDKRMLDINQKLMDSIERMQKANEAVIKSTDSAVASLAKQYDGMLAELQQNVTELKGGLAAVERDTANMREMILANDEKLEALQVRLADGKSGVLPEKSDYQKSYIYLIAGIGFLTLLLLSLFVFVKLKSRASKRSLQQDLSELSDESTTTADDELLSDTVAKEDSGSQNEKEQNSDVRQAWDKAAAEVARDEDGDVNNEDQADKEAKTLWNKALQHGSEGAVDTVNQEGYASEKAGHAASDSQPQDEVASDDEGPVTNGGADKQINNEPAKDHELSEAWSQALAEQKASDEKENAENTVLEKDEHKSNWNNSEPDELSKYIGRSGSEWLDKIGDEKSENETSSDAKPTVAESEAATHDDEEPVNQKDLADAWEAALAEQQAQSSTYDDNEGQDAKDRDGNDDKSSETEDVIAPKNEASAERAETVDAENDHEKNDNAKQEAHADDPSADPKPSQSKDKNSEADGTVSELSDDALNFEKAMKEASAASEGEDDYKQNSESAGQVQESEQKPEQMPSEEPDEEMSNQDDSKQDESLNEASIQDSQEPADGAVNLEDAVKKTSVLDDSIMSHEDLSGEKGQDPAFSSEDLQKDPQNEASLVEDSKQDENLETETRPEDHESSEDALSFANAMKQASASFAEGGTQTKKPDEINALADNAVEDPESAAKKQDVAQTVHDDENAEQITKESAQSEALKQEAADEPLSDNFEDLLQKISNGSQKIHPDEEPEEEEKAETDSDDGQAAEKSDQHEQSLADEKLKDQVLQADKKAFDAVMHELAGEAAHEDSTLLEDGQSGADDASALFAKDFAAMMAKSGKQNESKEPDAGFLDSTQKAILNEPDEIGNNEVQNLQDEPDPSLQQSKAGEVSEVDDQHVLPAEQENSSAIKAEVDHKLPDETADLHTQEVPKDPDESESGSQLSNDQTAEQFADHASYQDVAQKEREELLEKESANDSLSQDGSAGINENKQQADESLKQPEKSDQDAEEEAYLKIPQKDSSSLQSVEHWFVPDDEQDVPGLEFDGGNYPDGGSQDDKIQNADENNESVPPEEHWDDLEKQGTEQQSYSPFNWAVPKEEDFDALENSINEGGSKQGDDQVPSVEPDKTSVSDLGDLSLATDDQGEETQSEKKNDLKLSSSDQLKDQQNDQSGENLPEEQGHFSATYEASDPQTEAIVNMLAKGIPEQELEDHDESLNALDDEAVARMVSDEVPEESFGSAYENGALPDSKNRSEGRNRGLSKDAAADILKRGAFKDVLRDRQ